MGYLGIDVGNGFIKAVILENDKVVAYQNLPNEGAITTLNKIFSHFKDLKIKINGVGVCGAGRYLVAKLIGADVVKTEILAQSVGVLHFYPNTRFVIELGHEDSKMLEIYNGVLIDFTMNSLCSGGCGSYLLNVAYRFNIPIEKFSEIAFKSKNPCAISHKCAIFGTSAALSKFHHGFPIEDIIAGVIYALARNYLAMLTKGKKLTPPVVFSGGLSRIECLKKAFEDILNCKIITHPLGVYFGAIGMALLAKDCNKTSSFKGFEIFNKNLKTKIFYCSDCCEHCEITKILEDNNKVIGFLGSRCGKYELNIHHEPIV